ncbi:MAG: heavy metal translocating P-type ATPase [Hyphomonadaceae bacterium]|nr:heavy metal translocating P-type ATPase [Hyphomonadaceae bacterium]
MALALDAEGGCPSGLAPSVAREASRVDPTAFVRHSADGEDALELMVRGAKCAGCIRKIEGGLLATPGVHNARLNLSTSRLTVSWASGALKPQAIIEKLASLGYDAAAFDPLASQRTTDREGRRLLICLAVAGFAAMNVMTFSVPVWSAAGEMDAGVRTLLHWFSALVAIPAALYAGQPFFISAWRALRHGRANMDVPISLAVLLTLGMSLYETMHEGGVAYFDGAVMLLFLLLIGRYLDHTLREKARTAAKDLLALQAVTASRFDAAGMVRAVSARDVEIGDRLLLAPGERAPVNGVVEEGVSELDLSLLTGETAPAVIRAGEKIHAGAVNLMTPLVIRAVDRAEDSLVADLARLIEVSEQGRARFVRIADQAAALYVPVVHTLAAATFIGWLLVPILFPGAPDIGVRGALMNAVAVLIITCPCALGLAVPAVQVVATGRLFKAGVLVKSGDALERLAQIDCVVMDKTGTLTLGRPRLVTAHDATTLQAAAALARASRHPLARALVEAAGPGAPARDVYELAGQGLATAEARLGRQNFAAPNIPSSDDGLAEMWFARAGEAPVRFAFEDALRPDAIETIAALKARGLAVELLSGDRPAAVETAARAAGITRWRAAATPQEKIARLVELKAQGHRPLMLGDGLNDAAALAAAHASASPGSAIDVSQSAADVVFEGASLAPVLAMLEVARVARARVHENLAFSALYNLAAIPIAVAGLVTPLIAALAMSGSSLIVTLNALRVRGRAWTS